jgi:TPR repeat protein
VLKAFWLTLVLLFASAVSAIAEELSEELQGYMMQCERGVALSCRIVATRDSELNQSEKLSYLNKACGLGDELSCFIPSIAFDMNSDKERAIEVSQEYCNLGNGYACFMLASLHVGWENEATSGIIELFDRACTLENSLACTVLAGFYLTGGDGKFLVEVNVPLGLEFLNAACELQSSTSFEDDFIFSMGNSACAEYARIFIDGEHVVADFLAATELLFSSCNDGDRTSCRELGNLYSFGGAGLPQDVLRAKALYEHSCEMGDSDGCFRLAMHFEFESEETYRINYASAAYLKACELSDSGHLCLRAAEIIASRNPFEAKVAYEVGCSKQYQAVENCLSLGELYELGLGVRKNLSSAIEFYGKACDLRSQTGCENYARLN